MAMAPEDVRKPRLGLQPGCAAAECSMHAYSAPLSALVCFWWRGVLACRKVVFAVLCIRILS